MALFGRNLPRIVVGEGDRHDLVVLAMGGSGHTADQADDLLYELGRAAVVHETALPPDVVRMGSNVTASIDGGSREYLRLSYPQDAGLDGLSILSPVGTALLGLSAGQTMRWTDRNGKAREVRVFAVDNSNHGSRDAPGDERPLSNLRAQHV